MSRFKVIDGGKVQRNLDKDAAIEKAERRLLEATIAVREAIDELCDENGVIVSTDPEFGRKSKVFDELHVEEKAAWEELKAAWK
jgi:hypothetical protein